MKQFKMSIDLGNAAFEESSCELVRLLRETATRLESGVDFEWNNELRLTENIKDINGNTVGRFKVVVEE